jgi:type IV pilus assembly protein PilF
MYFRRLLGCGFTIIFLVACSSQTQKKSNEDTAVIFLQLGERYLELNKLELARENLQHALKLDEQNAQIYNAFALLNEKLHKLNDAMANYQQAFALNSNDLRIKNNYGRFLCEQGDTQQGVTLLSQAATDGLNERSWIAMTNLGRCYLQISNNADAEHYFMQALQVNADYSPALLEMQKIRYAKGDITDAKVYLAHYQRVSHDTAQSLFIAIKIENAAGNNTLAEQYKQLLLSQFPLSQEAKTLKSR